jgi:F-type H+-transporting ATPase subunit gamma
MANVKELKKRIKSTKSTYKITSAMKLVSAAKLSKIQHRVIGMKPYAEELLHTVKTVSAVAKEYQHVYFKSNENEFVDVLVISSSKGLCGSYNNQLAKQVKKFIENTELNVRVSFIGKKAKDLMRDFINEGETFDLPKSESGEDEVKKIASYFSNRFETGEVGKVFIAYNSFYSAMNCEAVIDQILPLSIDEEKAEDLKNEFPFDFKYEPSAESILDDLIPEIYKGHFVKAYLDSQASEHGMRMVAMDNASKNCEDMIKNLTLKMNKIRQAAITTELIEVVSGAESLKG